MVHQIAPQAQQLHHAVVHQGLQHPQLQQQAQQAAQQVAHSQRMTPFHPVGPMGSMNNVIKEEDSEDEDDMSSGNSESGGDFSYTLPAGTVFRRDIHGEWPEHVLRMSCRELNKFLKLHGRDLSADDISDVKRQRRRYKNRVYAKRSRDQKALQDLVDGNVCMAQLRAKVTRLQSEVEGLRQTQEELIRIIRQNCPDELSKVKFR